MADLTKSKFILRIDRLYVIILALIRSLPKVRADGIIEYKNMAEERAGGVLIA